MPETIIADKRRKYPEIAHLSAAERKRFYITRTHQERRESGLCVSCGGDKPSVRQNELICLECWFGHIALLRTGSRKNGAAVQALFDAQNGLCVYTGESLTPGVNASLDHKTPTSRGGDNAISNLQWVTMRINSFKNYLTHNEFIELCGSITDRYRESLVAQAQN